MLKSLYSGVSGLQSHQVAMDVESNNIANVNTVGFKYSRANFSDLLAQTSSIATAPQGSLGGKNAVQVGLGTNIDSTTRIFSQGSIQNTDKNTDVAIQGDGFFIVSPDGGNTYKYTRAGDFKFDAGGNFVDNNGFIVQGWLRDEKTGKVDSTAPISNIQIAPGLTTPASPTTEVLLKANLNSGSKVENISPAFQVPGDGVIAANPALAALDANGNAIASGNMGVMFNENGEAFNLQKDQGVWMSFRDSVSEATAPVLAGNEDLDITFTLDDGSTKRIVTSGGDITKTQLENGNRFKDAINAHTSTTGIVASYDGVTGKITLTNENKSASASHNINISAVGSAAAGFNITNLATSHGTETTAYKYQYDPVSSIKTKNTNKTFSTIADLREAMETQARAIDANGDGTFGNGIKISVNEYGKIEIINPATTSGDDYDVNLNITAISDNDVTENTLFRKAMESVGASLKVGSGGIATSQSFNAATHSSSIDIYDSLGSKHTVRMEYRKISMDTNTGSTWEMVITVPEPATIDTAEPRNEKKGSISFNNDGSMATYSPPNISFSANNGSAAEQQISLTLGSSNSFEGMTSYDSESSTSGISQDGYTGGDLVGIRVDQSGTVVGSFSNGRSFGLAQLGMAKFTNNEGLATEGGNVYTQTANSGDAVIGTAATSGRGFIQSSALEQSNVDLSLALTQLIIVQRGYQANGKTITTSDQLLETLIALKR